jgi:hypothetical protein
MLPWGQRKRRNAPRHHNVTPRTPTIIRSVSYTCADRRSGGRSGFDACRRRLDCRVFVFVRGRCRERFVTGGLADPEQAGRCERAGLFRVQTTSPARAPGYQTRIRLAGAAPSWVARRPHRHGLPRHSNFPPLTSWHLGQEVHLTASFMRRSRYEVGVM